MYWEYWEGHCRGTGSTGALGHGTGTTQIYWEQWRGTGRGNREPLGVLGALWGGNGEVSKGSGTTWTWNGEPLVGVGRGWGSPCRFRGHGVLIISDHHKCPTNCATYP